MRRAVMKARWLWLLAPLAVAASCDDEPVPPPVEEVRLTSCVEEPTGLVKPPSDQLPCELLPPGFSQ
jgi:hypothetical protein